MAWTSRQPTCRNPTACRKELSSGYSSGYASVILDKGKGIIGNACWRCYRVKEKGTVEQRCLFKRLETSSCHPIWLGTVSEKEPSVRNGMDM
jgi:hypothetical protein